MGTEDLHQIRKESERMKLYFGCDPNAWELKEKMMQLAKDLGHEIIDMGSDDPIYANTAIKVAELVARDNGSRGVLLCGTGLGMCIAANKVKGAYAALLSDVYSAKRAVLSNNANIACLGAFTLGESLAGELLKAWLGCHFDAESASAPKVARYHAYDNAR